MNGTFLRIARLSLALIYIWFGALKVIGASPANPLVASLLEHLLPTLSFSTFSVFFGVFEVVIGILFLLPKLDRITLLLFSLHMVTTFMPLLVLPRMTWNSFLIPTLEGQYIIKNVALLALAYGIYGRRVR